MALLPGTVTVAAVGKLRTVYWLAAQQEYAKRIRRYVKLDIIEARDHVGTGVADAVAMQREGQGLLDAVAGIPWVVMLDVQGKHAGSDGLARYLRKQVDTYRDLAFVIGGPVGLSDEVQTAANDALSLSTLTLPHELARVVLLEQLYRALTILNGEKYHK